MNDRKRLHRAEPARIAPVRNFSKLYRRTESVNGTNLAKPVQSDTPRSTTGGPLAQGVELAYSVIEKYLAEGQRTAEGLSNASYSTSHARTNNLQDILERVLRFQAEILPLWIESLATLVKVDPSRNGHAASPGTWLRADGGQNAEAMAVSIEVVSTRPVQVSVELRPNSEAKSLVALGLNAVDSKKPALTEVSFVPDEIQGRVKVRVRIPESQPTGTYSGVIVSRESGETRGTLSIRIAD